MVADIWASVMSSFVDQLVALNTFVSSRLDSNNIAIQYSCTDVTVEWRNSAVQLPFVSCRLDSNNIAIQYSCTDVTVEWRNSAVQLP